MSLIVEDNVIFRIQLDIESSLSESGIEYKISVVEACAQSLLIRDSEISPVQGSQKINALKVEDYPEIEALIQQITPLVVEAMHKEIHKNQSVANENT